jgi:hypothetical protein
MAPEPPFAQVVSEALEHSGLTLRGLCREADLDPSFFSKVLAGKRNPPWDEPVLRRIAKVLALDEAELIVAAGKIPSEWSRLWSDRALFQSVHNSVHSGKQIVPPGRSRPDAGTIPAPKARPTSSQPAAVKTLPIVPSRALAEELL